MIKWHSSSLYPVKYPPSVLHQICKDILFTTVGKSANYQTLPISFTNPWNETCWLWLTLLMWLALRARFLQSMGDPINGHFIICSFSVSRTATNIQSSFYASLYALKRITLCVKNWFSGGSAWERVQFILQLFPSHDTAVINLGFDISLGKSDEWHSFNINQIKIILQSINQTYFFT